MYLYCSQVRELVNLTGEEIEQLFIEQIKGNDKLREVFIKDNKINNAEVESWKNSIPVLISIIQEAGLSELQIIFEYGLPVTPERVDAILVGYDQNKELVGLIIELKQWTQIDNCYTELPTKVKLSTTDIPRSHPISQTHTYITQMRLHHTNVVDGKIKLKVLHYLHNFNLNKKKYLFQNQYEIYKSFKHTVFVKGEELKLITFLRDMFCDQKLYEEYKVITQGQYTFGNIGFENLQSVFNKKRFVALLAEQKDISSQVVKEIINMKLNNKDRLVILISGDAGTGKSVLGMDILRQVLIRKKTNNCMFTTPSKTLKEVMRGYCNIGIGNTQYTINRKELDCIIIDEAHRLNNIQNNTSLVIKSNKIIILLQDDEQRIRFSEEGLVSRFDEVIKKESNYNIVYKKYKLKTQMRTTYNSNYVELLSLFFSNSKKKYNMSLCNSYDVEIIDDLDKIDYKLKKLSSSSRCKWLAPFCWKWSFNTLNNDIIIDNQGSLFKKAWNPKDGQFSWYEGRSENHLDQVGCIYTSPGLEYEYVGFIFWDDLYWNGDKWCINLNRIQDKKFIEEVVTHYRGELKRFDNNEWKVEFNSKSYEIHEFLTIVNADMDEIIQLVINIYRVLLSRGTKGVFIWFKSQQTKEHFMEIMKL